ncbi:Retrovirus-related Pol polyprotein from transposon RE1 [Vitis vinifera]|uniref:Retrovirus-related Pol polyprotein from transposon RE1 n=1 Tax=Vitis vinifera TaxID=29760 RepID=A0A438C0V7_VITVI|nr:Retrovirus-related Pol polyprotein from transposon RE1 [Vitis vinifera]
MTEEEHASMANSHSSNGPVQNLSDDSSNSYYLHPSNNPGALLVSEIFTGENYIAWSRSMSIALTVKNKIAFVDGSLVQPITNDPHLRVAWLRANNLVLSWLMNSIAKEIRGSLLYFTNAFDIWEELKIKYLKSDGPRVFSLEKSLSSISQNSKSITEYFSEFKALWDEYISYRPIPSCRCGNLNRCSSIRSQLLLQSPLPSMSRVFSLLLQEESQRSLTNAVGISIDSQAMVVEQSSRIVSTSNTQFTKQKGKSDAICSHCGYSGHLVDKCFQLIGYPPGWKGPRGKRFNSTPTAAKNFQRLPTANNTNVLEQNSSNSNMIFSQEQIQNLLTLANNLSSSNTNSNATANVASTSGTSFFCNTVSSSKNQFTWILDTGEIDHMICSPLLFDSLVLPKTSSKVHLPNGQTVPIIFTGSVKFSPDITLHNALYDLSKWRMIGLAEVQSGLYHLQQLFAQTNKEMLSSSIGLPSSSLVESCTVNSDLWHFRLGHIPNAKIQLINSSDSSVKAIHNKNYYCGNMTKIDSATQAPSSCSSSGGWKCRKVQSQAYSQGYTQQEGLDFFDTYSPVAKMTTVRVLLAIAAAKQWYLHQLDVNNAFLHGDLNEEVYMQLPPGFSTPNDPRVCKLKKSLYGLRQASRQWYSKLSSSLLKFGFSQAKTDSSLFIRQTSTSFIALLIYVDDVIIASNDLKEIDVVKKLLHESFTIKDLGELKYFLGIEVARSAKGIVLSQRKYALDVLKDSGFSGSKPVGFPMESSLKLTTNDSSPLLSDPASYRRLIGRLLYLTITRPDLAYAVQALSQFMSNPHSTHLQAVERVLRYIKATPVFIGDSLISWKSKKQPTVSRSSTEAEYRALATTTCELQWLVYLLANLNVKHP